jgi:hypothetical protein
MRKEEYIGAHCSIDGPKNAVSGNKDFSSDWTKRKRRKRLWQ